MISPRIVVITGASGGLGQALARLHLGKGDVVIIASRRFVPADQYGHERHIRERLHHYSLDVTDREAIGQFADWVRSRFGRCDLLYNNAGTASFKPFAEMSADELEATLQTNIAGVLYTTRAFLPMMLERGHGHIVNIASLAGIVATAKASVYAASKAAVIRFSEGLRHELAGTGIVVTCVMPGPIDTPFLDHADQTGAYRGKVSRYLLDPEQTAAKIGEAVENKQPELALPKSLGTLSLLYTVLPYRLRQLFAPLLNRK